MKTNYFNIKRDNKYPFFCQACLIGKPLSERSEKDTRYCIDCQASIEYAYSVLADKGSWKKYKPVKPVANLGAIEPCNVEMDTSEEKRKCPLQIKKKWSNPKVDKFKLPEGKRDIRSGNCQKHLSKNYPVKVWGQKQLYLNSNQNKGFMFPARLFSDYWQDNDKVFLMKTYLELSDVESMEQNAGCLRDRLLIRLLFRLGCRISEALSVKVSDIDFERSNVTILHLKTRIRLSCPNCRARLGKRHQFCPKCGQGVSEARKLHQEHRRIRILPIDNQTLKMIKNSPQYSFSKPIYIQKMPKNGLNTKIT